MSHYVFITTAKFSGSVAKRINNRIKAISADASFVGPLSIPGTNTTGWIERPNDGLNSANFRQEENKKMAEIAREEIGIQDEED